MGRNETICSAYRTVGMAVIAAVLAAIMTIFFTEGGDHEI